ncbi:MAG: hypothetical protein KGJ11_02515, partial [Candidatus Omnitrophica bacterium]|nr:hypothetical protein [Candidatus Omnitrophota bacterium]
MGQKQDDLTALVNIYNSNKSSLTPEVQKMVESLIKNTGKLISDINTENTKGGENGDVNFAAILQTNGWRTFWNSRKFDYNYDPNYEPLSGTGRFIGTMWNGVKGGVSWVGTQIGITGINGTWDYLVNGENNYGNYWHASNETAAGIATGDIQTWSPWGTIKSGVTYVAGVPTWLVNRQTGKQVFELASQMPTGEYDPFADAYNKGGAWKIDYYAGHASEVVLETVTAARVMRLGALGSLTPAGTLAAPTGAFWGTLGFAEATGLGRMAWQDHKGEGPVSSEELSNNTLATVIAPVVLGKLTGAINSTYGAALANTATGRFINTVISPLTETAGADGQIIPMTAGTALKNVAISTGTVVGGGLVLANAGTMIGGNGPLTLKQDAKLAGALALVNTGRIGAGALANGLTGKLAGQGFLKGITAGLSQEIKSGLANAAFTNRALFGAANSLNYGVQLGSAAASWGMISNEWQNPQAGFGDMMSVGWKDFKPAFLTGTAVGAYSSLSSPTLGLGNKFSSQVVKFFSPSSRWSYLTWPTLAVGGEALLNGKNATAKDYIDVASMALGARYLAGGFAAGTAAGGSEKVTGFYKFGAYLTNPEIKGLTLANVGRYSALAATGAVANIAKDALVGEFEHATNISLGNNLDMYVKRNNEGRIVARSAVAAPGYNFESDSGIGGEHWDRQLEASAFRGAFWATMAGLAVKDAGNIAGNFENKFGLGKMEMADSSAQPASTMEGLFDKIAINPAERFGAHGAWGGLKWIPIGVQFPVYTGVYKSVIFGIENRYLPNGTLLNLEDKSVSPDEVQTNSGETATGLVRMFDRGSWSLTDKAKASLWNAFVTAPESGVTLNPMIAATTLAREPGGPASEWRIGLRDTLQNSGLSEPLGLAKVAAVVTGIDAAMDMTSTRHWVVANPKYPNEVYTVNENISTGFGPDTGNPFSERSIGSWAGLILAMKPSAVLSKSEYAMDLAVKQANGGEHGRAIETLDNAMESLPLEKQAPLQNLRYNIARNQDEQVFQAGKGRTAGVNEAELVKPLEQNAAEKQLNNYITQLRASGNNDLADQMEATKQNANSQTYYNRAISLAQQGYFKAADDYFNLADESLTKARTVDSQNGSKYYLPQMQIMQGRLESLRVQQQGLEKPSVELAGRIGKAADAIDQFVKQGLASQDAATRKVFQNISSSIEAGRIADRADMMIRSGSTIDAAGLYEKARALDPDNARYYFLRESQVREKQGGKENQAKAIDLLNKAADLTESGQWLKSNVRSYETFRAAQKEMELNPNDLQAAGRLDQARDKLVSELTKKVNAAPEGIRNGMDRFLVSVLREKAEAHLQRGEFNKYFDTRLEIFNRENEVGNASAAADFARSAAIKDTVDRLLSKYLKSAVETPVQAIETPQAAETAKTLRETISTVKDKKDISSARSLIKALDDYLGQNESQLKTTAGRELINRATDILTNMSQAMADSSGVKMEEAMNKAPENSIDKARAAESLARIAIWQEAIKTPTASGLKAGKSRVTGLIDQAKRMYEAAKDTNGIKRIQALRGMADEGFNNADQRLKTGLTGLRNEVRVIMERLAQQNAGRGGYLTVADIDPVLAKLNKAEDQGMTPAEIAFSKVALYAERARLGDVTQKATDLQEAGNELAKLKTANSSDEFKAQNAEHFDQDVKGLESLLEQVRQEPVQVKTFSANDSVVTRDAIMKERNKAEDGTAESAPMPYGENGRGSKVEYRDADGKLVGTRIESGNVIREEWTVPGLELGGGGAGFIGRAPDGKLLVTIIHNGEDAIRTHEMKEAMALKLQEAASNGRINPEAAGAEKLWKQLTVERSPGVRVFRSSHEYAEQYLAAPSPVERAGKTQGELETPESQGPPAVDLRSPGVFAANDKVLEPLPVNQPSTPSFERKEAPESFARLYENVYGPLTPEARREAMVRHNIERLISPEPLSEKEITERTKRDLVEKYFPATEEGKPFSGEEAFFNESMKSPAASLTKEDLEKLPLQEKVDELTKMALRRMRDNFVAQNPSENTPGMFKYREGQTALTRAAIEYIESYDPDKKGPFDLVTMSMNMGAGKSALAEALPVVEEMTGKKLAYVVEDAGLKKFIENGGIEGFYRPKSIDNGILDLSPKEGQKGVLVLSQGELKTIDLNLKSGKYTEIKTPRVLSDHVVIVDEIQKMVTDAALVFGKSDSFGKEWIAENERKNNGAYQHLKISKEFGKAFINILENTISERAVSAGSDRAAINEMVTLRTGENGQQIVNATKFKDDVRTTLSKKLEDLINSNPDYGKLNLDINKLLDAGAVWYEGLLHGRINITRAIDRQGFADAGLNGK